MFTFKLYLSAYLTNMFHPISIFLIIAFTSISANTEPAINDVIRQKLELSVVADLYAFNEKIHCSKSIKQIYTKYEFAALWYTKNKADLITALEGARLEGLNELDYHLATLKEASAKNLKETEAKANLDILFTDAFLLYSSHLLSGKVNAQSIEIEWFVSKTEADPITILEQGLKNQTILASTKDCLPKHAVYTELKAALKKYTSLDPTKWKPIAEGKTLRQGDEDVRISEIEERLIRLGDLKGSLSSNNIYTEDLFTAMLAFQTRHGLEADGAIGINTLKALNISIDERIGQIKANLERWRWLPRSFGNFYILVNIANYDLVVMKDGVETKRHKVIAGKTARKTPVFSSKMSYVVLKPTWTVPPGIIQNDIIPAMQKDPSYLSKKNIELLNSAGNIVDPKTIDWNTKVPMALTYRQPLGKDNALGAVKFMFPNSYFVYIHDTPSKDLFNKNERAFSSGCIRTQDPLLLAEHLLNDPSKWSIDQINKVVETKTTQTIMLSEQPNVYILYWTAWYKNGQIQFRKDIYERYLAIIKKLDESPVGL